MGKYKAAVITTGGQNLIAQALANEQPLVFTSAKTSSYSYPVGTDIPALTGLQDVLQTVLPFDSKVLGGNVAQVSARFDNDGVDQTYRIETIGLYAKIEGGEETLFSVTQAITPDEMPVQSDVSPSAYIYNIQHTVQNASQITLTVNPAGTATVQDIMDIENPAFDDSGTVEGISSFPDLLTQLKSKMNFFEFFRNLKAGLQFVLHAGQIVNSCVSDRTDLPLSAAQGKILKDLYTQLYSDLSYTTNGVNISSKSLDVITRTGDYKGNNITELIPYVGTNAWCIMKAHVQSDNAASMTVIANSGYVIGIYREPGGTYKIYPLSLKADLENRILDRTCDSLSSGYLTDATLVTTNQGESNSYSRINSSAFRVHKDYTKNMPSGCSFGVRTCQNYDGNNVIIKIEEFYPVPGRIWSRKYVIGTGWNDWKSITPE